MRLDKYLKVARIIKRRTVANEACDTSRVTVNVVWAKYITSAVADNKNTQKSAFAKLPTYAGFFRSAKTTIEP